MEGFSGAEQLSRGSSCWTERSRTSIPYELVCLLNSRTSTGSLGGLIKPPTTSNRATSNGKAGSTSNQSRLRRQSIRTLTGRYGGSGRNLRRTVRASAHNGRGHSRERPDVRRHSRRATTEVSSNDPGTSRSEGRRPSSAATSSGSIGE